MRRLYVAGDAAAERGRGRPGHRRRVAPSRRVIVDPPVRGVTRWRLNEGAMEIVLATCSLRPWKRGDEASLTRHANDREVWRNLRDLFPHPYTMDAARDWVRHARTISPPTDLAVVVDGAAIGGIGLVVQPDMFRRSAEIGYWLGQEYWGRGIATEAVTAFVEYAFSTFDLVRLYAGIIDWNVASGRVLEKAGFVLEGRLRKAITKDGQTADELIYALVR
jgi:RimJ/RimL family protein N-acetyltransferase